jgi:hypothetical protein
MWFPSQGRRNTEHGRKQFSSIAKWKPSSPADGAAAEGLGVERTVADHDFAIYQFHPDTCLVEPSSAASSRIASLYARSATTA